MHADLAPEFDKSSSKHYRYLGELLKEINSDLVTDEELRIINSYDDSDYHYCDLCADAGHGARHVQFGSNIDIYDNRQFEKSNSLHNEFEYDINCGHCDTCGTLHIRCVDCNYVIPISDWNYDETIECDSCGLVYQVYHEYNSSNPDQIEIKVKEESMICQKCSLEFRPSDMREDICKSCEDNYSYK